jgi:20S proteasome alpha/beta subunit
MILSRFLLFLLVSQDQPDQYNPFDKQVNIFNEQGELLQVEYANKAGKLGDPLLCGISKVDNEVVICAPTSKRKYALLDQRGIDKISKIDPNFYLGFSGIGGDGQYLVNTVREHCVRQRIEKGYPPSIMIPVTKISEIQHSASLKNLGRPLGVETVTMGWDSRSKLMEMYVNQPSGKSLLSKPHNFSDIPFLVGDYWSLKAAAIGRLSSLYIPRLEKEFSSSMTSLQIGEKFQELIGTSKNVEDNNQPEDGEDDYREFYLIRFDEQRQECRSHHFPSFPKFCAFCRSRSQLPTTSIKHDDDSEQRERE